jgi:hypothetical protein
MSTFEEKEKRVAEMEAEIAKIREKIDGIVYGNQNVKNSHFESSWMHYCDDADPDVPYRLNNEMLLLALK